MRAPSLYIQPLPISIVSALSLHPPFSRARCALSLYARTNRRLVLQEHRALFIGIEVAPSLGFPTVGVTRPPFGRLNETASEDRSISRGRVEALDGLDHPLPTP